MKVAPLSDLQAIRSEAVSWLASFDDDTVIRALNWGVYHGFKKAVLERWCTDVLPHFGYTSQDVQVEVVWVDGDLRDEIHHHAEASACIVILGECENLPNPREVFAYLEKSWFPVDVFDEIDIPAGTSHGFTMSEGGILYFLSVQSPPITGPEGRNDYHKQAE